MKLNLGCSDNILPGFENVDNFLHPNIPISNQGIVQIVDLNSRWPWDDNSIEFIFAADIIEHLKFPIWTMNEMFRILKPGSNENYPQGVAHIVVPTTDGPGAFQDPTHVSYWNRNSFKYYERGNSYRDRFAETYGIEAAFDIIAERIEETADGPKLTIELRKS